MDVVVLNNKSIFDSTSSRPICTKITENTYQLISNHSRKSELNRISGRVEFDVDLDVVVLNNKSIFDSWTSSRPICTKITENTYQLISNHSRKSELNRISGRVEFDVDFVALNNNSLFDSTFSGPICTKITGNTYQLISNHSRKFEHRISGSVGFDVNFVALFHSSRPICTKITENIKELVSNHSRKFELNRISESVEFDVDLDVIALNNSSLFRVLF